MTSVCKAVRTACGRAGVNGKKGKLGGGGWSAAGSGDGEREKHGFPRETRGGARLEEDAHGAWGGGGMRLRLQNQAPCSRT